MRPSLKYTVLAGALIIAAQYWALATYSCWLTRDDSKAVEDFSHAHRLLSALAAGFWVTDSLGGRYLVIVALGILCWWMLKPQKHEPHDS